MRRAHVLPLTLAACLLGLVLALPGAARADDAPPEDHPLAKLAYLVGEFAGEGTLPGGTKYQESFVGTWILRGTAIEIRSKSTVGGKVVFEDRRILSVDSTSKKPYRMRQWAEGRVRVFSGSILATALVLDETAQEGGPGVAPAPAWRYSFTPKTAGGFDYGVQALVDGKHERFVGGSLTPHMKDPGQGGGLGIRQYDATVAGMAAQVHHPDGKGPYPLIVFSPGGDAATHQGYRPYGRWFATWGYVTIIVAFDDKDATARGTKFAKVIDWAHAEHARGGSPLRGLLDTGSVVAAGHSRGGFAALVAGGLDARIDAVLALAPSGPSEGSADAHAPKVCVVAGTKDDLLGAGQKAYALQRGERFYIEIDGMEHMLGPREQTLRLVRRATAFLEYAVRKDARYRATLAETADGVKVTAEAARKD